MTALTDAEREELHEQLKGLWAASEKITDAMKPFVAAQEAITGVCDALIEKGII